MVLANLLMTHTEGLCEKSIDHLRKAFSRFSPVLTQSSFSSQKGFCSFHTFCSHNPPFYLSSLQQPEGQPAPLFVHFTRFALHTCIPHPSSFPLFSLPPL